MAFTAGELQNIANAALDFYIKGDTFKQSIQAKPLIAAMKSKQKMFPGGKGNIDLPVVGDYVTTLEGYTHNDQVSYANPATIKRVAFPWKELHAGISMTLTELKHDGISVVDSLHGGSTSKHSGRELTVLTGLLENKLQDMGEGWSRSFNAMLWADGTQDAKEVPGIKSIITDDPTTGTVGGIDRATTVWWRNRSLVNDGVTDNRITSSTSLQTLTKTLRSEARQLTRYGGKPDLILCGSAFLEALESEVFEKGVYTQNGFVNNGTNDIGMADIFMRGVGRFVYDPTLDDIGESKRAYFIDTKGINLYAMTGEDMKQHTPARPADQYVLYRAVTWTGGMVARQCNSSAVYEIA